MWHASPVPQLQFKGTTCFKLHRARPEYKANSLETLGFPWKLIGSYRHVHVEKLRHREISFPLWLVLRQWASAMSWYTKRITTERKPCVIPEDSDGLSIACPHWNVFVNPRDPLSV